MRSATLRRSSASWSSAPPHVASAPTRPTTAPLHHRGSGWLGERRGHYADALSKRSIVHLVHTETTSAFSPALDRLLRSLAATSRLPDAHDATSYGTARTSPHTFYAHHAAAISSAIAHHEALTIQQAAERMTQARCSTRRTPHACPTTAARK